MGANDESVVTSMEFSRMLDARAGGNEILLAIAGSMALMLRFEVKGRATVGGVEYVREGGPCEGHNRYAVETIEIGEVAAKTAERDPKGWVVVGAALRPWRGVRDGLSGYRRRGVLFSTSPAQHTRLMQIPAQLRHLRV
ncbi:hypothetical protein JQ582_39355 [Bradyrhizobium japonicum]|uniref:hypothetical protein n=1 Tax=Bradyrhizobium japonicum TaxID=375 RepID=UPI001BA96750|nr:hypothetical protein [Bradyrhizobium japonicum]MBR0749985.1 hypothetical protein [Bradyrhizobium japonicum]